MPLSESDLKAAPQPKFRKDYTPPAFWVSEVALDFDLGEEVCHCFCIDLLGTSARLLAAMLREPENFVASLADVRTFAAVLRAVGDPVGEVLGLARPVKRAMSAPACAPRSTPCCVRSSPGPRATWRPRCGRRCGSARINSRC